MPASSSREPGAFDEAADHRHVRGAAREQPRTPALRVQRARQRREQRRRDAAERQEGAVHRHQRARRGQAAVEHQPRRDRGTGRVAGDEVGRAADRPQQRGDRLRHARQRQLGRRGECRERVSRQVGHDDGGVRGQPLGHRAPCSDAPVPCSSNQHGAP